MLITSGSQAVLLANGYFHSQFIMKRQTL